MSKKKRASHPYTLRESADNFEIPAEFLSIHNEPFVFYDSFNTELSRLFNYFEDTYICRRHERRRENPNFSINTKNQFDRIINDQPRIKNKIDGWHRGFSSMFNHVHPNIFVFLKKNQRRTVFDTIPISTHGAGQAIHL
ncbi:hypothetical protein RF11_12582 [Thelohanellus kitauei]|uniref:Uncharacterized protein n=1 Tax=Thelohanellus kitauei TaxID=669202 RepID=A0A0C2IUU7_THEKT|nr:hypothetical protein RF11_12582 [Thelohanellus kitauei]